ncbi:MAG: response regulator [Spirochaetales bacterium]|nr:response regulator [Spirochaetales bacterium]
MPSVSPKLISARFLFSGPRRVWILILLFVFFLIVVLSTVTTLFISSQISGFFLPIQNSMDEIKNNLTESHLWFEEYLTGDISIDLNIVNKKNEEHYQLLLTVEKKLREEPLVFLFGGREEILAEFGFSIVNFQGLNDLTVRRARLLRQGQAGTRIDQEYDLQFGQLRNSLSFVDVQLERKMKEYIDFVSVIDNTLKILTVLFIIVIGIVLYRYIGERQRLIGELSAANSQLGAGNQQLAANEQQLRAGNQQLMASEQQLRAANQQLSANEQQLQATVRQLSQNQQALFLSENKFRQVVENIPAGVAIYERTDDNVYVIKDFNSAAENIEKVKREAITGKPVEQVFPGVRTFGLLDVFERVFKTGEPEHFPVSFYQDTFIHGWRDNYVFKLPSGEIVTVYTDETRHKKTEEELQKAQKLESLGILAGGIAHDFNNLLGAIFGYVEMAYESCDSAAEVGKNLEKALSAYHRAKDLTRQLLTFSRGGMPVKEIVPLEGIITDALDLSFSGSSIRSEVVYTDNLWLVIGDAGQLTQVFSNLLINARQAMPEGGRVVIQVANRELSGENEILLDPGRYLEISIQDEGAGIPEEIRTRIFDPFFTTKKEGQGLGLATVYSIIKKHGGHIVVSSPPGVGTHFSFWLPATDARPVPVEEEEESLPVIFGRILVMDDEEMVLDMLCAILKSAGVAVCPVKRGEDALEEYRRAMDEKRPFDMVILDLTIAGGIGGIKTIQELKNIDPDVKAVVSSGYSSNEVLSDYKRFGFMGAVTKPFRKKDILKTIAGILTNTKTGL